MKKTERGNIDSFIHFANMLSLDKSVLAVTGNITREETFAGIVISGGKHTVSATSKFDHKPLQPSG